ncbi:copper resistance system multicopper oxidase [Fulvimonas soli]|jgi:CopA family copper-resistance protein|uniref:CopA family copper-resistance protein n=1 Tax=Fulvimonas soli TaxID=155197 RepID=A0A316IFB4_9GAMM|nr:copper resistance system multicopper oxidase [Fulvimonas soli]PWK91971.1 CopA family copper-resistance protein [Fulvimonas soli]TNY27415.1 copper resistance protein CopA [Fulvimonas soli]
MNRQDPRGVLLPRRRFVQGLALGGVAAGLGWAPWRAPAQAAPRAELRGTTFELEIGELPVDFTGRRRLATVVNGRLPAPLLRWRQGDTVTLRVRNVLPVTSSIHWHGIVLPADMDGVPGLSFDGIPPGGEYVYRFAVNQAGTYWYHGHSRFQEQTGLYGPIVIEPRGGERHPAERDHVVLLSDWTDDDPERIYANLKKQSDYYNRGEPTVGEFLRDAHARGLRAALDERRMWQRMRMDPSDLADVSGAAYTYLMNGHAPAANWTGLFAAGERVRLRFINGSSMSFFDVRIPGLKMTVVAADGQDVEPVSVDEFRLGTAETLDVIVRPAADRAWTIFAQSMDRSGYACGTLAPRPGLRAEVPPLDPRPRLAMADMMGAMGMAAPPAGADGMPGMDHAAMDRAGMGHAAMDHMAMGHGAGAAPAASAALATGPEVDMRVARPRTDLDDPGVGLRGNGRRVLGYADLRTLTAPISPRVDRELTLRLTGNMQRYLWSFDAARYAKAPPLRLRHGEHVRITLVNDTMMTHPIHLHGMWSELEDERGEFLVRKHTVSVQPAQRLSYRVSADAAGRWAYHCHLLYHMEAGMFREVVVA